MRTCVCVCGYVCVYSHICFRSLYTLHIHQSLPTLCRYGHIIPALNLTAVSRKPLSTSAVRANFFDEIRRAHTFPVNSFSDQSATMQHPTRRKCQYSDIVDYHSMKKAIKNYFYFLVEIIIRYVCSRVLMKHKIL